MWEPHHCASSINDLTECTTPCRKGWDAGVWGWLCYMYITSENLLAKILTTQSAPSLKTATKNFLLPRKAWVC